MPARWYCRQQIFELRYSENSGVMVAPGRANTIMYYPLSTVYRQHHIKTIVLFAIEIILKHVKVDIVKYLIHNFAV